MRGLRNIHESGVREYLLADWNNTCLDDDGPCAAPVLQSGASGRQNNFGLAPRRHCVGCLGLLLSFTGLATDRRIPQAGLTKQERKTPEARQKDPQDGYH